MYIYKSTVKKKGGGGGGDRFTKSAEKASYQELALGRSLLPFAPSLENYLGLARLHKTRVWLEHGYIIVAIDYLQ